MDRAALRIAATTGRDPVRHFEWIDVPGIDGQNVVDGGAGRGAAPVARADPRGEKCGALFSVLARIQITATLARWHC